MVYLTAEQALQQDVSKLGPEYGTAVYYCRQELWRVSSNWDRYEALFGSQERVDILNSSNGSFWHSIQYMLHDHVLLGLCRLTDPAGSGNRQNLSIRRLLQLDPTDTKDSLSETVEHALRATAFARSWRDKRISHNDLELLTTNADLLHESTALKVSDAIVAVHNVLRWITARYLGGDLFLLDIADSDVMGVLVALARGRSAKARHLEDIASGRTEVLKEEEKIYPRQDYGRAERYAKQKEFSLPSPYTGALPLLAKVEATCESPR